MKKLLTISAGLLFAVSASASDADILREACVGMKAASKREQCVAALDRLTHPLPAAAAQPVPMKPVTLNLRAFMCKPHEFAELNSMNEHELASASCSYQAGLKAYQGISDKSIADARNSDAKLILMQRQVSEMEKCGSSMMQTMDLQKRKFPNSKADCAPLQKKIPATEGATSE